MGMVHNHYHHAGIFDGILTNAARNIQQNPPAIRITLFALSILAGIAVGIVVSLNFPTLSALWITLIAAGAFVATFHCLADLTRTISLLFKDKVRELVEVK